MQSTDSIIWDILKDDQRANGFEVNDETIHLPLDALRRARARGGFTVGQLVHQARLKDWTALTFDDITGSPYRALASRSHADVTTEIFKGIKVQTPFVSANMESVTGPRLAITLAKMGAVGVLHQFCTADEQAEMVKQVKSTPFKEQICIDSRCYLPNLDADGRLFVGAAIGVKHENIERAKLLAEAGVDFIVVDIAHGHSDQTIATIRKLKELYPHLKLVAGNVVTPKGAYELCEAGVDALKVGVGPGAACTTRMVTGYGVPQITAIYETSLIARKYGVKIMADGGVRTSGDMVKALAAGADTIMCGSMWATTDKSNDFDSRVLEYHSKTKQPKYIKYYGSASALAKSKQKRGGFDSPEGREVAMEYTGSTELVLAKLLTGIQSGISYAGASRDPEKDDPPSIARLRTKSRWIRQTPSGAYEGTKGIKRFL